MKRLKFTFLTVYLILLSTCTVFAQTEDEPDDIYINIVSWKMLVWSGASDFHILPFEGGNNLRQDTPNGVDILYLRWKWFHITAFSQINFSVGNLLEERLYYSYILPAGLYFPFLEWKAKDGWSKIGVHATHYYFANGAKPLQPMLVKGELSSGIRYNYEIKYPQFSDLSLRYDRSLFTLSAGYRFQWTSWNIKADSFRLYNQETGEWYTKSVDFEKNMNGWFIECTIGLSFFVSQEKLGPAKKKKSNIVINKKMLIDDSRFGNGDGIVDLNERVEAFFTLSNVGSAYSDRVTVLINPVNPRINVVGSNYEVYHGIAPGEVVTPIFTFIVDESYYGERKASISLQVKEKDKSKDIINQFTFDIKENNIRRSEENIQPIESERPITAKQKTTKIPIAGNSPKFGSPDSIKVYVWNFEVNDSARSDLAIRFTEAFEEALIRKKCFTVLERRNLDFLAAHRKNEKEISKIGGISNATADSLRYHGANSVIIGKVDDDLDSGHYTITAELLAFDGQILNKKSISLPRGRVHDAQSRQEQMNQLAEDLCEW